MLLEVLVEVALLGEHGLALHQPRDSALAQEPVHDAVVLLGVSRPVDPGARRGRVPLELLQVVGEPRKGVRLDLRGQAAQLLPCGHEAARDVALVADEPDRLVVPVHARLVRDERSGALGMLGHRVASSSSSATCRTRSFLPSRRIRPSRCMRQELSAPGITSAPARSWSATRSRPMAQETASSLTAKVPPNPQHSSARDSSASCRPSIPSKSARVFEYGGATLPLPLPLPPRRAP